MATGSAQQTQYINPISDQCWSTSYDAGPALARHWINVLSFNQCRINDGPPSTALAQLWIEVEFNGVMTLVSTNVGSMLARRRQRWPNIGPTLD